MKVRGTGGRRHPGEGAGPRLAQLGGVAPHHDSESRAKPQKPTLFAFKDSENYAKKSEAF